ncbi:MAG: hypothetical protein IJX16_06220 [Clostridia bacterium]|nr:hypothetical protein [Clostridia bacterium]
MSNFWVLFLIGIFCMLIGIVSVIMFLITKPKHYVSLTVFFTVATIGLVVLSRDFFVDLVEQKTTDIVAVYISYKGGGYTFGHQLIFENDEGEQISLYSPKSSRYPKKLQEGKVYKITYFNNTRIVKEFSILLE